MAPVMAPLLQEYVVPPDAESVVLVPAVMVTLLHAMAVGLGLTTTVTESLAGAQLPLVTITEYVVVPVGDAVGLETEELLSPVEGFQL